jgi:hypothetical protein
MFKELRSLVTISMLVGIIVLVSNIAQANWLETFDGDEPDLATWQYECFPDMTKTFTNTIVTDPNGNKYLSLDETSTVGIGGSAFGSGFGTDEVFTDVRVGAVVNVTGDASWRYCGLVARTEYFVDPDGSMTGVAPGFVAAQTYVMHVSWNDGPANLRIDLEKVIMMSNIMRNSEELGLELLVPGLNHARSYYAEMDVVGSGPVYVTGSLYEYKDGPLVARTATMVDTNGNDPWEDPDEFDEVFTSGASGIFAQNEDEEPVGYHCTFDDIFSVSDGPAAVNPSPANGAIDAPIDASLSWIEAEFATGRELWIGKAGAMEKVDPAPSGTTYTPAALELGETYEWRIDQIGPSGTVTGRTWTFTAADYLIVDDFESYTTDEDLRSAWVDNIEEPGVEYVLLASGENQAMLFEFQNQYDPYFTEITRTFANPQDWTAQGVDELSLSFIGEHENAEHLMYLTLEDAAGQSFRVETFTHACQSDSWRQWPIALVQFSDEGVDLTSVKKITIGLGDGTDSGQGGDDRDHIYIDQIILRPAGS